jgi:hypothetical protein
MAVNAAVVGTIGSISSGSSAVTGSGTSSVSGSDFVIVVTWFPTANGGADLTGVQDSKTNTWVQKGSTSTSPNGDIAIAQFVALNGTGGTSHTATANFANANGFAALYLVEVTGTNHTVDVAFTQGVGASSGTTYPITSGVLAQSTEGVIVFCNVDSGNTATFTGTNFTVLASQSGSGSAWPVCVGFALPGTTASTIYTFTYNDTGIHQSAQTIMTFEAASGAPADQPPSHEWDFDDLVVDDWDSWDSAPVGQSSVVPGPDDAWDWYADDLTDDFVESNSQPVVPNSIIPVYEDPWEWFGDDLTDDYHLEHDSKVPPIAIGIPSVDDAWDWFADDLTEEFEVYATAPVVANVIVTPTSPPQDEWDWWSDDYEDELVIIDDSIAENVLVPEDPWDWDDAQDEDWWFTESSPVVPNAVIVLAQTFDDWDFFADDVVDDFDTDSQPVGPNSVNPTIEDAWDWSNEDAADDDWWTDLAYPAVDIIQPPDHEWDWTEDQGEDDWWFAFDPPQTLIVTDSTFYGDDAWDWFADDLTDEFESDASPVVPDVIQNFSLTLEDGWDWYADDLTDEFESDVLPVAADATAPFPDDSWNWDDDDTGDDEWWWTTDYAYIDTTPPPVVPPVTPPSGGALLPGVLPKKPPGTALELEGRDPLPWSATGAPIVPSPHMTSLAEREPVPALTPPQMELFHVEPAGQVTTEIEQVSATSPTDEEILLLMLIAASL